MRTSTADSAPTLPIPDTPPTAPATIRSRWRRHLKDIRDSVWKEVQKTHGSLFDGVMAGFFTVPGDGVIDFRPILQVLADSGYEGWLMVEAEQDARKAHPLTYAKKARAYLRDIIGW